MRAIVVALEHTHIEHVLTHKQFLGYADNLVAAVLIKDDDVVQRRDVHQILGVLVLFERSADKTFVAVDVQLLVGLGDSGGLDGVEAAQNGVARVVLAVFAFEAAIPFDGEISDMLDFVPDVGDAVVVVGNQAVGVIRTELEDALHLYLEQAQDVVAGDVAQQLFLYRFKARVHKGDGGFHVRSLLIFLGLVYALLDEIALEACEEQLLTHLAELNLQLAA